MRTFRRVLSSINYLFPKLLTLDPSGAAAATMLVHGLLILAELLNWYVFYIPDWVFGAQMKVRTFALVIDWKKIDSRSGVQLGDGSQSSLRGEDPALFFFPGFLAKVTPVEHVHVFGSFVGFFWSASENLGFGFPEILVADLELVALWMLLLLHVWGGKGLGGIVLFQLRASGCDLGMCSTTCPSVVQQVKAKCPAIQGEAQACKSMTANLPNLSAKEFKQHAHVPYYSFPCCMIKPFCVCCVCTDC